MARPTVVMTGLRELDRNLARLSDKMQKKLVRSAVRKAAKPVLDRAKELVPTDTGDLRRSLKIRALKRSRRRSTIGVQVVTGVDFFKGEQYYGGMIEFGTSKMNAKPFLRPAADQSKGKARLIFRQELRSGIIRETRKLRA